MFLINSGFISRQKTSRQQKNQKEKEFSNDKFFHYFITFGAHTHTHTQQI
jgi:hypothetical protein